MHWTQKFFYFNAGVAILLMMLGWWFTGSPI